MVEKTQRTRQYKRLSRPFLTPYRAASGFFQRAARQQHDRIWRRFAALSLLCLTTNVLAAPGFITGSKVTRGTHVAEISIRFACSVEYVDHLPANEAERLRIQVDPTAICNGVSPAVARSREQHRPLDADKARLIEISYDGGSSAGPVLTLAFSEVVSFDVVHSGVANQMTIRVYPNKITEVVTADSGATGIRVQRPPAPQMNYVINLSSSRRPHSSADSSNASIAAGLDIFESEVDLAGVTWYRLRTGHFKNPEEAQVALTRLQEKYPTAWIDRATTGDAEDTANSAPAAGKTVYGANKTLASMGLDKVDELMADARRAMIAEETSRAVQIYTKVLRVPGHDRLAEAQEYLALAREKAGQKAHAKAEYQRYLAMYPNGDGAARVGQRLASLLASDRQTTTAGTPTLQLAGNRHVRDESDWRIQTFFSQFYRRDVNQLDEQVEIVSQSALYSDINLDARRRGQRFDFGSRLSAGYRNDFLSETRSPADELRVSYAYADLADAKTRLRGRIGRQSRNSGGILGRFDGVNLGYHATERILVNAVAGLPVNSSADSLDSERTFHGLSVNFGPVIDALELGVFYIAQDIEGVEDRQAVGSEFRYFGENQNIWGLVDYDTSYGEISSAFLQGSWRIGSHFSIHGSTDRRHSPYLSTRNAMIGQPVQTFSELLVLMTGEEIHQLSLDRAPLTASYTLGISQSISPRLQISLDANQTTMDSTPESGGIAATQKSTYRYFSTSLVASSLLKEGDVTMIGLKVSDSGSSKVISLTLDSRFPIGMTWRINPRLRIDRRQIRSDASYEWLYTPGIRIQIRRNQKYRIELEAGKRFLQRDSGTIGLDRESYFISLGYQAFF